MLPAADRTCRLVRSASSLTFWLRWRRDCNSLHTDVLISLSWMFSAIKSSTLAGSATWWAAAAAVAGREVLALALALRWLVARLRYSWMVEGMASSSNLEHMVS